MKECKKLISKAKKLIEALEILAEVKKIIRETDILWDAEEPYVKLSNIILKHAKNTIYDAYIWKCLKPAEEAEE